jgi:colanic acid/amylovoran biosynthesis glycosyltransferase
MSLAVLPALTGGRVSGGSVRLTHKFIDGMKLYAEYWPGPVVAYMEESNKRTSNLDEMEVNPSDLTFGCELVSYTDPNIGDLLAKHEVVLGSCSHRQTHLSALCRSIGVPFLFVSEFSLKTEWQIICADTKNPVLRLRRLWWIVNQERRMQQAVRLAAGMQCNGTPTYEVYSKINPRCLLYFDTRTAESMFPTEEEMDQRNARLLGGEPVRLMFSGRLIRMKGADELVRVADALRKLGVKFHMTICGDGALAKSIRANILRHDLSGYVACPGILDYKSELVPLARQKMDLFVCCHRTGDPSCTYLETMACGLPIIAYANEAFEGVVRESKTGFITPMGQPERMAAEIARLNSDRQALVEGARKSLEFAQKHTFERTCRVRIDHLCSFRSLELQPS